MIIYRNMKPEDLISVYALLNTNLDGSFSLDVIEYFMSFWPEGQYVAVDLFGNIVGALCGTKLNNGRASIALFAVEAAHRGQGIGNKLFETFRTKCYMSGFTEMQLELRTDNSSAYKFYTKRGFAITEKVFDLYGPGENGYRMVARISHVSS
jgi:ribosomal protein S18 acetylase RimI-like enzyme